MEVTKVSTLSFIWLGTGFVLFIALPVLAVIIWLKKKKEPFTSVLTGALTFLIFALLLEKPIQNILLFPSLMKLPQHPLASFISNNTVLLAFIAGLFPGLFEETGRFIAFRTVLKKRKNRETSISYGLGHGCFEVILILGLTYFQNIIYSILINTGLFESLVVKAVQAHAPEQLDIINVLVTQLTNFSLGNLALALVERIFAVLFHVAASILVFYACKERKKFFLYPLAIILHTLLDFIVVLSIFPLWGVLVFLAVFSLIVFTAAYFLLYKKDLDTKVLDTKKEAKLLGD